MQEVSGPFTWHTTADGDKCAVLMVDRKGALSVKLGTVVKRGRKFVLVQLDGSRKWVRKTYQELLKVDAAD